MQPAWPRCTSGILPCRAGFAPLHAVVGYAENGYVNRIAQRTGCPG
jgi:hypothetical protein